MKNRRKRYLRLLAIAAASVCLCGCSGEMGDGDALPDGKYPMTFTAQVDGLTATRATADNTWNGTEEIAIQIGSEVKKYTAANGGSLAIAENGTPFYWQTTSDITVNAWYPYSTTKPSAAELRVKTNQSEDNNYQASDYLEAVNATVTFADKQLAFKHRTSKVVVTLKAGEGVTNLTGAAVTFVNQTGVVGNGTEVTPKTETANAASTYTALVIPQQMQGEKFIKVTVGAGNAARDYFYTPANSTDANLEAGKQYNYTITVKKTGLQVESVTASWNDNATDGDAENATFKIHLATFSAPENTSGYKVTDANGSPLTTSDNIYTTSSSAISISLSANESYTLKKFLTKVTAGICKQKAAYTADTRTYTYTFYDIHSDLWLDGIQAEAVAVSSIPEVKVGDYYYADGTWSGTLTTNSSNPCIGIVFKVGAGMEDNVGNYNFFFMDNTIHGYVVALEDAHSSTCAWGGDGVLIGTSTNQNDFVGYSNTQKIIAKAQDGNHLKPDNAKDDYPAAYYISEYDKISSAPQSSNGWYFPSTGQLKEIYNVKGNIHNDMLRLQSGDYLSSSEYDRGWIQFNVGCVSFANGNSDYKEKDDGPAYVRAILTF